MTSTNTSPCNLQLAGTVTVLIAQSQVHPDPQYVAVMPARVRPVDPLPERTAPAGLLLGVSGGLLVAAVAGAGLAALKGRGFDAAYVLGNSSVGYLLVPFLAGWLMSRRSYAVALGLVATQLALAAFYFTASTLYLGRLSLDFSLGRWFIAGAATGIILSLLGHAARQRSWLLYLVPALLLLEPAANAVAAVAGVGSGAPAAALAIAAAVEAGLGLGVLLLLHRRLRPAVGTQ